MNARQFLTELKGRGVYRVAAIYSAGAWALLQVADILFPLLGLPNWSITAVLGAAAAGFPAALVLAWMFDLTPQGIVEAPGVVPSSERHKLSPARVLEFSLILILIILVGYLYVDRLSLLRRTEVPINELTPELKQARPSIAVMPFVSMSERPNVAYFGDGLAEEILNLLAKLDELNVAARTSSFYFKDKDVDIQQISERLGVAYVLEGSVRYDDQRVRVTAQLISAADGFHLWSETYDRDMQDIFHLQDEIARKVVENLQVILSPQSEQALVITKTIDPAAYDFYLQGRAYLRRPMDAANLQGAVSMFTRAVELDADYSEAYAGLCDGLLGQYYLARKNDYFTDAEKACHRALTLDSQATAVYVALGNLYRTSGQYALAIQEFNKAISLNEMAVDAYDGLAATYVADNKTQQAEEAFLQAIELQPNYWRSYVSMGNFLFREGRFEQAIPYYQRITELMPESESGFNNLGAAHYLLGNFDEAAGAWKQSLDIEPSASAYANTGSSLFFMARFEEAVEMYLQAAQITPEDYEVWGDLGDAYRFSSNGAEPAAGAYNKAIELAQQRLKINTSDADTHAQLAHYYAALGKREQALESSARATTLAPQNMYVHYDAATMFTSLGELERALAALETAIGLGYSKRLAQLDAGLKKLRELPQFEVLTGREE